MGTPKPPLVYACSGCSSAAQMANQFAIRLDRVGLAEMSCISGVGGHVPALLRLARSGRPILALDGCVLACVSACLERAGVTPTRHVVLAHCGVKKRVHADFEQAEADRVFEREVLPVAEALRDATSPAPVRPAVVGERFADPHPPSYVG